MTRTDGRLMTRTVGLALRPDEEWREHCAQQARLHQRLVRDGYGTLRLQTATAAERPEVELYAACRVLLNEAVSADLLPEAYDTITWEHKGRADGNAVHHEIYDIADGPACIVCVRKTEGTRYGVRTISKRYHLVTPAGVTETHEPVAKLAKSGLAPLGSIVRRCAGDRDACRLDTTVTLPYVVYKTLAVTPKGLCSIFSGEPYRLGTIRREAARENHRGGTYSYGTIAEATRAEVPDSSVLRDAPRVVVRCDAGGSRVQYDGGKIAWGHLRPVEIVASVITRGAA